MFRCEQVIGKYCKVYFGYNINKQSREVSTEGQMKNKIITMCNMLSALCKFIKVRVNVNLKDDPKAHDIIHSIFGRKINYRIQEYLVSIDYWYENQSHSRRKNRNIPCDDCNFVQTNSCKLVLILKKTNKIYFSKYFLFASDLVCMQFEK